MAKYSRMKKYENYRNQIQMGNEDSLASNDLKDFSDRLSRIDENIAKDVEPINYNRPVTPTRVRSYNTQVNQSTPVQKNEPVVEPATNSAFNSVTDKNTAFKNEYLDEFLDEVKKYNVDNGYANAEDTQLNIFASLKDEQPKKSNVIESYQNGNDLYEQTQAIAKQKVQESNDLMDEHQLSSVQESVIDKRNSITQELQTLLNDEPDVAKVLLHNDVDTKEVKAPVVNNTNYDEEDLLAKTAKQTVHLTQAYDEMDEDLDELEDKMGKNTRIVNFILALIVLALIVVLIVIVYAILLMRGII